MFRHGLAGCVDVLIIEARATCCHVYKHVTDTCCVGNLLSYVHLPAQEGPQRMQVCICLRVLSACPSLLTNRSIHVGGKMTRDPLGEEYAV